MRTTDILRLVSTQTIDTLKKSMSKTIAEATPYLNSVKEKKKQILYQNLTKFNNWYTRVIGLDVVRQYQERVTSLQEQLLKTQERRREVGRQLSAIRQKSLELQDEIHKVKRQDNLETFLDLMKRETEILKMERGIETTFQDYDQMERELFTAFTNAIRDSHEKQRAQVEYTKYFGLILSIAGSFLTFCYSTVKKQDLKKFIEEKLITLNASSSNPVILNLAQANEKTVHEIIKNREALKEVLKYISVQPDQTNGNANKSSENHLNLENIGVYYTQQQLLENDIKKVLKVVGGICLALLFVKMISG